MAQQEGGWPLGLQPLNVRVGLIRNLDFSGSLSFNTLTTGSPSCSSVTSSDLDSESTGSFFHDRSITLGSLIGITSNILEPSSSSLSSSRQCTIKEKKNHKQPKACFSLCPRSPHLNSTYSSINAPSLGHFLQVERRACNAQRNRASIAYEIDGLPDQRQSDSEKNPNSLFSNGIVAPHHHHAQSSDDERGIGHGNNGHWSPLIFPCMR